MRIIAERPLREFAARYPDAAASLETWRAGTKRASWASLADVRERFSSADIVGRLTVFNIAGNTYRLITYINYTRGIVYIRAILTHAEYDKGAWKRDPWY